MSYPVHVHTGEWRIVFRSCFKACLHSVQSCETWLSRSLKKKNLRLSDLRGAQGCLNPLQAISRLCSNWGAVGRGAARVSSIQIAHEVIFTLQTCAVTPWPRASNDVTAAEAAGEKPCSRHRALQDDHLSILCFPSAADVITKSQIGLQYYTEFNIGFATCWNGISACCTDSPESMLHADGTWTENTGVGRHWKMKGKHLHGCVTATHAKTSDIFEEEYAVHILYTDEAALKNLKKSLWCNVLQSFVRHRW